ncbi:hypothetical protein LCGC14_0579320 [marine sediment metagenome]|uniref:Uncharacterized protein n=1 Tax=marine sediment metagenome TaxID=412755 RepID=A0A0F9UQ32_9ZZZZ
MDKLELKHVAPYLPYGLIAINIDNDVKYEVSVYQTASLQGKLPVDMLFGSVLQPTDFKPILRPLLDLTKEIEHNGEKFVPYNTEMLSNFMLSVKGMDCLCEYNFDISNYTNMRYYIIQMLIKWHFDVFGLIEKGLAIDMNTLTTKDK